MNPSDIEKLARQFVHNAVAVQPGENIWIEHLGSKARTLAEACAARVQAMGAHPFMVDSGSAWINRHVAAMSAAELNAHGLERLKQMQGMQGYIRVTDDADRSAITLSPDRMKGYMAALQPMLEHRVNHTRWLVVATPTEEFAAACGMPYPQFAAFYRDVCLADYGRMTQAVAPLQALMAQGKTVRLVSPAQETNLRFSIEGIDAVPCTGKRNIPDGECYTAPVKESIDGTIKFGPSNYQGQRFAFVKLGFRKGRIETAEAENAERTAELNRILDTDAGGRYTGEFAISFNPFIQHPVGNILFDEKIDGALHLAMGQCYDRASNGNKSAIHWDMIHIQRPDYGGGEIWIDDRLIRKDGLFVVPELQGLNPENLKNALDMKN
jgi:aminopeptidase